MKTEELIDQLRSCAEKNCPVCPDVESCTGPSILLRLAAEKLTTTVEVVRCEDCKHWKFIDGLNPHWECQIFCGLHDHGYLTGADDFCSYGKRK